MRFGISFLSTLLLCTHLSYAGLVLPFTRITSDNNTNIAGQLGLLVDQTHVSSNQVRFMISNYGPVSSEIAEIYWDDAAGLLTNIMTSNAGTSSGVGFQYISASPGSLPAGNNVSFSTSFAADEGKPGGPSGVDPGNGITPGTMASFAFDITGANTYQTVESAVLSGQLRVGLHVRSINEGGIGDGNGDSFVSAVPEPSPFLLVGAIGALVLLCKRFARSR